MLYRCCMNKSFHVSVSPGKHQCIQSSCFFPPAEAGCASALSSLMGDMFKNWKLVPLRALERCWFTRRASTLVPSLFGENSSSAWKGRLNFETLHFIHEGSWKWHRIINQSLAEISLEYSKIQIESTTCCGNRGCCRWQEPPWFQSPPSKCLGDCVRKNLIAPDAILFSTYGIYDEQDHTQNGKEKNEMKHNSLVFCTMSVLWHLTVLRTQHWKIVGRPPSL